MLKQFKLNILRLLLSNICWIKGNNYCFTYYINTHWCWHAFRHFWKLLVPAWFENKCYWMLHFDAILCDLDLWLKITGMQESKKVVDGFGWNMSYCWDLFVWWISYSLMKLIPILSSLINIQGRKSNLDDIVKKQKHQKQPNQIKHLTVGLHSDFTDLLFSNSVWW